MGVSMQSPEQEFNTAFEKHSDELFRHAVLRLSDRERAVDITQQCFLRAWEYLVRGGVIGNYRPFLYRTLNNLIIDEYRRHKSLSLDALLEDEEKALAVEGKFLRDETDLFEEAAIQFEAKQALRKVALLPENYRAVIVMRYIDELSLSEIAECLQENENTVSVRIHRALRKLRELYTSPPYMQP